jgi:hypothetical protein
MRTSIFTNFAILFSSTLTFAFPLKPETGKECEKSAQERIQSEMTKKSSTFQKTAYEFNTEFSECVWRTPEAKNIKWPETYAQYRTPSYLSFPMKDLEGNWFIAITKPFSDSFYQTYLNIKKDGAVSTLNGPSIQGPFYGYNFGPFNLNKTTSAVGIMVAYVSEQGSHVGVNFIGPDGIILQTTLNDCSFSLEPDPRNLYGKFIQSCKTSPKKVYQWNGLQYSEEEPTEWLEKYNAKPKAPAVIEETRTSSSIKKIGDLSYVIWTHTQKPKGKSGTAESEWIEIKSGVSPEAMKKLNLSFAEQQTELMMDPDEEHYGESYSKVSLIALKDQILTVKISSSSMGYMMRSYDDGYHASYDLKSGKLIKWSGSFKSYQEELHFKLWVWNLFSSKAMYVFPDQIFWKSVEMPHQYQVYIPREKGLEVLLENDHGGHYFSESLGEIPYAALPVSLNSIPKGSSSFGSKDLIITPKLDCKRTIMEFEKKLCSQGLSSQFDNLLMAWEKKLETKVNTAEEFDQLLHDYINFTEGLVSCGEVKDCYEKALKKAF